MASRRAALAAFALLLGAAALWTECRQETSATSCAMNVKSWVLLQWRLGSGTARPGSASTRPGALEATREVAERALSKDSGGDRDADSDDRPLPCQVETACPLSWVNGTGGYFCPSTGGCRPVDLGLFPDCEDQCYLGFWVGAGNVSAPPAPPAFTETREQPAEPEPTPSAQEATCEPEVPCPADWRTGAGGYFCRDHQGCRPVDQGPFPDCQAQCYVGTGHPAPIGPPASAEPAPAPTAAPGAPGELPPCAEDVPCPADWRTGAGGYFCQTSKGCRPADQGGFPDCEAQCYLGNAPRKPVGGPGSAFAPLGTKTLKEPGNYDLRVYKADRLVGCAAPVGLFAGNAKYGCAGPFGTAQTCDAARHPVKDTKYVAAVHAGCLTAEGKGTYAYAYDDGVGLKQCAPVTKYEWILCPDGNEVGIDWEAEDGATADSSKRFRVTNKCEEPVWIQMVPAVEPIQKIEADSSYDYSIPNRGLPSLRYLPKTGCDEGGNSCDIQSMPPCPPQGCDALAIETKFEASWGCRYATGAAEDRQRCTLTAQGNPSTYQDWWDGSAVDGWTLPFTVLVDDSGHGLSPFDSSGKGSSQCQDVVCADLRVEALCPVDEFLTPDA